MVLRLAFLILVSFEFLLGRPTESERLASGHKTKFLPSVAEFAYDWLRTKGYLENVRLSERGEGRVGIEQRHLNN